MGEQVKPRVFGWATDKGGCLYYRLSLPFEQLAKQCDVHQVLWKGDQSVRVPKWADTDQDVLVVAQRLGEHDYQLRVWQNLRARNRMLVYEVDDDLLHVPASNPVSRTYNNLSVRQRIEEHLRISTMVTVSTQELAEVASSYNDNVKVLPNMIPESWTDKCVPARPYPVIGWAGSPTHREDFEEIVNPLRKHLRRWRELKFHAIGTDYVGTYDRYSKPVDDHSQIYVSKWNKSVEDYHDSIDFDIAILPLKAGGFNRCKSDIKFLEMAAKGICCIASNVGPYARVIQHGVTGLLYDTQHEFAELLVEVTKDESLRQRLGDNARKYVKTRTIEANVGLWMNAYKDAGLKTR